MTMIKPDLQLLAKWLDPADVEALDKKRHQKKEWRRHRKLGTLETLWLMLAVSLDTRRDCLHEILRLATGELNIMWTVSVAGFCKARARFSPGSAFLVAWQTGVADTENLCAGAQTMARIALACSRQDESGITRILVSLEMLRRTWGIAGIGTDLCGALLPL
jgi:hypothetical protein